jgi:alpha-N-arabinofuranosidase
MRHFALSLVLLAATAAAQTPTLRIDAAKPGAKVSPTLWGLMTEEINYSYDGGLYGELVRNRNFKEDAAEPVHWSLAEAGAGAASIMLDPSQPFNDAIQTSLKLTIVKAPAGIANSGFWGIPVKPATLYQASFFAKADFAGPLSVALVSDDGQVLVSARVAGLTAAWKKFELKLKTPASVTPSTKNRLVLSADRPGNIWFSLVSLFGPTYKGRVNGNRPDIMALLADMKPAFLRFPGGNYLEGNTIETRFDWKKTLGDISTRPGHMNDAWHYWSSDGMGLLEFLLWCEELRMEPVLGVYAGYSLHQQRIKPGADLEPYVQDALDEIEYVSGAVTTKWGARRAKDGHPAPFKLQYVEVGNEDQFDREAGSYDGRFAQFFDAIKAKYPHLHVIATTTVKSRVPDVMDEHYYPGNGDATAQYAYEWDKRPRSGPKVFVGEYATRVGVPTPNMAGAIGDGMFLTSIERNSDLVIMAGYAPLFVNVNPGGMQWRTNLIGYDGLSAYGSPAYYAQVMFSRYAGDVLLTTVASDIPTRTWQPPAPRRRDPNEPQQPAPPPLQVPTVGYSVTRDTKTGTVFVKIVNRAAEPQAVRFEFTGLQTVEAKGETVTLSAKSLDDTNSITEPKKVVPVTAAAEGFGREFTRTFEPFSITVLQLKAR